MKEDEGREVPEEDLSGSDGYLREVTIGEPEVLDGQIHLAPYDREWPLHYERLADRIRAARCQGERTCILLGV